ncbi:hypothetical protein LINPERHAP1_LOCUS31063 [Linum perenne]
MTSPSGPSEAHSLNSLSFFLSTPSARRDFPLFSPISAWFWNLRRIFVRLLLFGLIQVVLDSNLVSRCYWRGNTIATV